MKLSRPLKKSVRIATPVLLALLLTIAVLARRRLGAAARPASRRRPRWRSKWSARRESRRPGFGPARQRNPDRDLNRAIQSAWPLIRDQAEEARRRTRRPPQRRRRPQHRPHPPQPHPSAPFTPPTDCIVAHAATPAQLCSVGGGLQYYFIGADGSSSQGPWISPFGDLATAASASVYSGTNPLTGKSVQITYLAAENKIRISTFYPDTEYDTNKPYNFTVDANNSVSHEAW